MDDTDARFGERALLAKDAREGGPEHPRGMDGSRRQREPDTMPPAPPSSESGPLRAVFIWQQSYVGAIPAGSTSEHWVVPGFVDTGHPALLRMWANRQRGYRTMGYRGSYPKELAGLGIKEYRQTFFKPYRVIYRVTDNKVIIYLIADGRRDMQSLLARRLLGS